MLFAVVRGGGLHFQNGVPVVAFLLLYASYTSRPFDFITLTALEGGEPPLET